MKYVYICPHCKSVMQKESDLPQLSLECTQCHSGVLYAKCTLDEWNGKGVEEKEALKTQVIRDKSNEMAEADYALFVQMQAMGKDIRTIRGILVYFTVISALSVLYFLASTI